MSNNLIGYTSLILCYNWQNISVMSCFQNLKLKDWENKNVTPLPPNKIKKLKKKLLLDVLTLLHQSFHRCHKPINKVLIWPKQAVEVNFLCVRKSVVQSELLAEMTHTWLEILSTWKSLSLQFIEYSLYLKQFFF